MKKNKKPGNRKRLSMDEKFANAEKILAGKELHPNGKKIFDSVLKKSVSIKQHSVK